MRAFLALLVAVLLVCFPAWGRPQVVYSAWLIRHGDRTPYANPASRIHCTWAYGPGQLTAEGMRQEFRLGQEYRRRYVEREHLLPASFQAGTLSVMSTEMDRTIMSAQCVLAGLYPPGTGPRLPDGQAALPDRMQVVPIVTLPSDRPNFICAVIDPKGEAHRLVTSIGHDPPQIDSATLARWEQELGTRMPDLQSLISTADYVYCMLVHHKPLPSGFDETQARALVDVGFRALARVYAAPVVARAASALFFQRLDASLEEAARTGHGKVDFYSGHDTSILPVLSALGHPLDSNPPYAAHVEFDLLKEDNGTFWVEVRYNDRPLAVGPAPATRCTLDQFRHQIRAVFGAAQAGCEPQRELVEWR